MAPKKTVACVYVHTDKHYIEVYFCIKAVNINLFKT